ncbi:hypothetical protein BH11BAC3_BH11BAC3_48030 [soil metagenome]
MKNILYCILLITSLISSCNIPGNPSKIKDAIEQTASIPGCYESVTDKDTIRLNIEVHDNIVTGNLSYILMEKDKNTGTLKGRLKADTIFADYIFMSEGTQSTREVAFIKKGNYLIEGFGPVEETTAKVVFKNRSALVFEDVNRLAKIDCPATNP